MTTTVVSNRTEASTGTTLSTVHSSTQSTTRVTDDSDYVSHVMVGVGASVVAIILVVAAIFFVRSRQRRKRNVQLLRRQMESTGTSSLELTDTMQQTDTEGINATFDDNNATVHHALYDDDSRIPVMTRNVRDRPKPHIVVTASTVKSNNHDYENNEVLKRSPENTNKLVVKPNTPKSQKNQMIVKNMPSAVTSVKPLNESHYETAFPLVRESAAVTAISTVGGNNGTDSKPPIQANPIGLTDAKTDTVGLKSNNIPLSKCGLQPTSSENESNLDKLTRKPKPSPRLFDDTKEGQTKTDSKRLKKSETFHGEKRHDYENALSKIKSAKFKDAKLLRAVPPPCKFRQYVNVPDENVNEKNNVLETRSSVYENPDLVAELKRKDGATTQYANLPVTDDKDKRYIRKTMPCEYENSETAQKLQLAIKGKGKRGHSTSSVQTARVEPINFSKTPTLTEAVDSKEKEVEYLEMECETDEEFPYLPMNSPVSEIDLYYTEMLPTYSFIQRLKTAGGDTSEGIGENMLRAPEPCGLALYKEYTNYKKAPMRYMNFFRSKSSDDIYTYADPKIERKQSEDSGSTAKLISKRITNHN